MMQMCSHHCCCSADFYDVYWKIAHNGWFISTLLKARFPHIAMARFQLSELLSGPEEPSE